MTATLDTSRLSGSPRSCRPNKATRRNAPVFAHFTDTDEATIVILYPHHAELRRIRGADGLPLQPVERAVLREAQQWPVFQPAVHRVQEAIDRFVAAIGVHLFQLFQGNGLQQAERSGLDPTQLGDMRATTQKVTNILDSVRI